MRGHTCIHKGLYYAGFQELGWERIHRETDIQTAR
jgi:hypothetical protein